MLTNLITTIDQFALNQPQAPAYNELGQIHTYAELKQASDTIAVALQQYQLPAQAPIVVYGDQSFMMLASFLGCVKAGHAYIPIDTHSAADRLSLIVQIAHPALIIAVEPIPYPLPLTLVTTPAKLLERPAITTDPQYWVSGTDNFYIIFTSGTTGQPKGVQISHRNLLSFINWQLHDFELPQRPAILAQAPYSFDLSVMTLYPTLALGGTITVLPKIVTDNLASLFKTLPQLSLNVWVSTPSFMDICLLEPKFDQAHYPTLSHFLFCGEELPHHTVAQLQQRFPQAHIFNTYGPTEATVAVTAIEITPEILAKYPRLPIGYAKHDTTITTTAEHELLLTGPSIAKGYLNRPTETRAAFTGTTYHSGDLGTITADGLIFYHGRKDFQIKLNGYRIELEEVNYILNQMTHVKQAAVVPQYTDHKVKCLVAFIVPTDQITNNSLNRIKALKRELTQQMMPYMIPQRFIYRPRLPLTANGKIDFKLLQGEVNPNG